MQFLYNVWYLDLYISRHLINNKDFFILELYLKCLNFTTVEDQILQTESIGTVDILPANKSLFKLYNIAYTPNCDANLIFLGQLCNSAI